MPSSPPPGSGLFDRRAALQRLGGIAAVPWLGTLRLGRRAPQRLRLLGNHAHHSPAIQGRAEQDLGLELSTESRGTSAALQQAIARPESFDLFEEGANCLRPLWDAGAIRPLEVARIDAWDEVSALTKTGRLRPTDPLGRGDAPHRLLYVQPGGELSSDPSPWISFLPTVHNADSFAYDTAALPAGQSPESESWSWLLDPRWSGRVALVNEPSVGVFDAALAAQGAGLLEFDDLGALSRTELDALFALLIERKQAGHFCGLWSSVPQSIRFFESGRAQIGSLFVPAVGSLRARGLPVRYAAPREGYRAWHGILCLSSACSEAAQDAAYRYINWWLEGWVGAQFARRGLYVSVPQRARQFLGAGEWEYWYGGQPAARDLPGIDGKRIVRAGERRSGGSYEERFARVAVWNSVMDTYEYSLQRWYEFLSA